MRLLALTVLTLLVGCGEAPAPSTAAKAPAPTEIIREPTWVRKPTPAEIAALRPAQAADFKLSAVANLWCTAAADGTLRSCQIDWQDPPALGFGEAALQAAPLFRMQPTDKHGPVEGRPVEAMITWPKPGR